MNIQQRYVGSCINSDTKSQHDCVGQNVVKDCVGQNVIKVERKTTPMTRPVNVTRKSRHTRRLLNQHYSDRLV